MKKLTLFNLNELFLILFVCILVMLLAGCGALGLATPGTFNERALAAEVTVDQVQQSATVLLRAKKISSADAENVLKTADAAMAGIGIARTYAATDPAAASNRLGLAIASLTAVQAYLVTQGASQ